ncbi:ATPase, partial [Bifidobacteriaceae bacterium VN003]
MNMSVNNKSIGVKQIDKNYNNGEAVGAFRDVKRYVYPPQVADKSIYESVSNGIKIAPCIADDHTVMTLFPKSSQDVESFQNT